MLKHVVLIQAGFDGIRVDSHACVKWPYPKADPETSRAMLQMIGGSDELPKEIVDFIRTFEAIQIRSRFQSNARLAIIDDEQEALQNAEAMERHLRKCSRKELERLFGTREWIHSRGTEHGLEPEER